MQENDDRFTSKLAFRPIKENERIVMIEALFLPGLVYGHYHLLTDYLVI